MPANGHFASRLHGAPIEVARVHRSKFSGEVAYLADWALPRGPSTHAGRVRCVVVPEEGFPQASDRRDSDLGGTQAYRWLRDAHTR